MMEILLFLVVVLLLCVVLALTNIDKNIIRIVKAVEKSSRDT